ncbi:hypothetical protein [Kocuria massiliensis]|uniref:hypothetical protein n=1 Tax=Kocuria massiliensis TaxID=1926282 RepID=UPI0022B9C084|nr:hypothetical protein [Kocuria massiliensis]
MSQQHEASVAELINRSMSRYGLSKAEIARMIDRSPRIVTKIQRGELAGGGENYRAAFEELADTGSTEVSIPRARTKSGRLRKVRAASGAEATSRTPRKGSYSHPKRVSPKKPAGSKKTARRPRPKPRPFAQQSTDLGDNNRLYQVQGPPSPGSKGRNQMFSGIRDDIRRTARNQRHEDKRMKFTVQLRDKKTKQISTVMLGAKRGYHASDVLADIRTEHGGNVEDWLKSQVQSRRPGAGPWRCR